jgi:hypothetical protein
VRIVTLAEGEISELHIGLKGTMNALFLKDLADKVRRRPRRASPSHSSSPTQSNHNINDAAVEIIRRVFREFAAGMSPRAIANRLDEEGIPGPDGGLWTDSTSARD